MVTIKLARAKQNIHFHSPSSPHQTVKKKLLKKICKKPLSNRPKIKKEDFLEKKESLI
jgi:hypothetical protein